jgi:hypothetical protein
LSSKPTSPTSGTNPKGRRYANVKKSKLFGHTFDSKKEARHYLDLRDQAKRGIIDNLELQPRIPIVIGGVAVRYHPSGRQMVYVADFRYMITKTGQIQIDDVKMQSGFLTEIYKFKRALIYTMGLTINEVT